MPLLRGSILAEMLRGDKPRPMNMMGAGAKVSFASTPHWSKKAFTVKNAPYTIDFPTRAQLETRIKFGRKARSMRGRRGMQTVTRSNSKAKGMNLPAIAAGIANSSLGRSGYSKPAGMHASELRRTVHTVEELEALRSGAGVSVSSYRPKKRRAKKGRKAKAPRKIKVKRRKTKKRKAKVKVKTRKGKKRGKKKGRKGSKKGRKGTKKKKKSKVKFKSRKGKKKRKAKKKYKSKGIIPKKPGTYIIKKGKLKGRRVKRLASGKVRFLSGKKKGAKRKGGKKRGKGSKRKGSKRKGSKRKSKSRRGKIFYSTKIVKGRPEVIARKGKRRVKILGANIGYGRGLPKLSKALKKKVRLALGAGHGGIVSGGAITSGRAETIYAKKAKRQR
jgi:hypothetical protein